MTKVDDPHNAILKMLWRGWESDPRPRAYESPALATELPRHAAKSLLHQTSFVKQTDKAIFHFTGRI
jgi:hypothetical protein